MVNIFYFNIEHPKFKLIKNKYNSKFELNTAKMMNNITEIDQRNKFIINIIDNLL